MSQDAKTNQSKSEKTTVFNLIILDESGSMMSLSQQTVSGCNETLNIIRSTAKANPDTIRSLVSIYEFQSNEQRPSHYLIKNAKPEDVKDVTLDDYKPWGGTPLLDAVGSTLTELKAVAATHENSTGIVTIITDGYENSSHHYTWQQVSKLISELKEIGWTINLIGANVDVEQMGNAMNIDNRMEFVASSQGTTAMYESLRDSWSERMNVIANEDASMPMEERISTRKANSSTFFRKKK